MDISLSLDRIDFTLKEYNYIFDSNYFIVCEDTTLYGENYTDVTSEWIINAKPNTHIVKDRKYFEHSGIKYKVDNKNIVLDYSNNEKDVAIWLENTFGGEIYMLPRINKPDGIQTADYLFRGEYWDLKTINGKSNQVLFHSIYKKKTQSNNFIFNIISPELNINELQKKFINYTIEKIQIFYKKLY